MKRAVTALAALGLCLIATACASASHESTDAVDRALRITPPTTTTTPSSPPCKQAKKDLELESYAPLSPLPPPGSMPEEMSDIVSRGYLIAGVDDNTPRFSSRNPATGAIEGLEVALVHEIARAIFGDDTNRVHLKTIVTAQKVPFAEHGNVDLTVSAVSISCERWRDVAFSTEYFTATHKLLVPLDSRITADDVPDRLSDVLRSKRVCVTKGSSSVGLLAKIAPDAVPVKVDARSDCLMKLQQARADAYLGHDSFMYGMVDQDRSVTIVPGTINDQHYGIAIQRGHEDLASFVNGVLDRMRDDGTLLRLYGDHLKDHAPTELPPVDESGPPPRGGAR